MNKATAAEIPPDGAAELEAAFARVIEQIDEVRAQMKLDDAAIAQLKADNAALKAESAVLKAETRTLCEETRTIIANLRSAA